MPHLYTWWCQASGNFWCRLFAPEAIPQWVAALAAIGAAFAAAAALRASRRAVRSTYRPFVRPFRSQRDPVGWFLLLKNYGSGPAITVLLFNAVQGQANSDPKSPDGDNAILGQLAMLEPLGPRDGDTEEWERVGRLTMKLSRYLEDGREYRIIYQDRDGVFHETRFRFDEDQHPTELRYLGERRDREVPQAARDCAFVQRG